MKTELLTLLATKLRENAANPKGMQFDISAWYKQGFNAENPISCGTTGCAMGLAALLPEFQALGLKPEICPDIKDQLADGQIAAIDVVYEHDGKTASGGVYAAMNLFEISYPVSESLFMPDDYEYSGAHLRGAAGELEVATRIEFLVDHGEADFLTKYSRHAAEAYDSDD